MSLNVEKFGVLHTFLIDSYRSVFGFKESVSIINKNGDDDMSSGSIPRDEIIYGYNNLNIDFNKFFAIIIVNHCLCFSFSSAAVITFFQNINIWWLSVFLIKFITIKH